MAAKIDKRRTGEMMKALLRELQGMGGEARAKDLIAAAGPKLNLTDYEAARLEKSGNIRWTSVVHFYSIDCSKAGYIRKQDGKWYLTPEGEQALEKLDDLEFIETATSLYREWDRNRPDTHPAADDSVEETASGPADGQSVYDEAVEAARTEVETHLRNLNPYEFQDLVAELLRGMGYHVPFVAPKGRDGGIDITAYTDPLGSQAPRIRVQVKHRNEKGKVTGPDVRNFESAIRTEGDMGLIVSTSGFTPDAEQEIRATRMHIERMDLDRLISLWEDHYDAISQKGRKMLPLVRVHFLAPPEE